jgi:2-dehydro-3-deoxyphosphogluconate aldolase/(4S)-4-hydroxy-2-oxoglutarate aldolase
MPGVPRIEVVRNMYDTGLVPLFYHPDIELAVRVVRACYDGGARVFEFTNRGDAAHDVFEGLCKEVRSRMPELALGVGSVVDAPSTALYLQIGADFVVSPIMNPRMASVCNRRKVLWIPGCGTLTEISRAEELGAEIVKIFPAEQIGGPDFIRAVRGPCPWTSIMPTGGVSPTEESLKEWFDAGASCVGIGSKLMGADLRSDIDLEDLRARVEQTLALIRHVR